MTSFSDDVIWPEKKEVISFFSFLNQSRQVRILRAFDWPSSFSGWNLMAQTPQIPTRGWINR